MTRRLARSSRLGRAAKIASLEALNQSKEKEAELKKYADTYPEITLREGIDKLHFQDVSAKQTLKDLVA